MPRRGPSTPSHNAAGRCGSRRAGSMLGRSARSPSAQGVIGSCACRSGHRMPAAGGDTDGRACGRTCTRPASGSARSASDASCARRGSGRGRANDSARRPSASTISPSQPMSWRGSSRRRGRISGWVGDTTEFVTGSSAKVYLAAILDLYSRFVVGWALSAVNGRHLTLRALDMAMKRRCPDPGLLHHSDQGCTYASEDYRARLAQHGIACSMSRRGNCYDCEDDGGAVRPVLTLAYE